MRLLSLVSVACAVLWTIQVVVGKPKHLQFDDYTIQISAGSQVVRPNWTSTFSVQLFGNGYSDSSLRFVYKLSLNDTAKQKKWGRYRVKFSYRWPDDTLAGLCKVQVSVYYWDSRHSDEMTSVTTNSITLLVSRAKLSISSDGPTPPGGRTQFTFEVEEALHTRFLYNWIVNCLECKNALIRTPQGAFNGTKNEKVEQSWAYNADVGQYLITVDVYFISDRGCVFLVDSASLNFELTDKIITHIDVVYSSSGKSVCPSCCATPGDFDFRSIIHNPGDFYDPTSLIFDWQFNFPAVQSSNDNSDDGRKPKHDSDSHPDRHSRSSNNQVGEDVVNQEIVLAGNYDYTLTVTGNSYETGDEHSGQITRTICIQDPITGVICEMVEDIKVLENITLTLSCNGSYPINYCISTCENPSAACTGYMNSSAMVDIYFEEAGECYINVTAMNSVSALSSVYNVFVSDESDTESSSGPSYAAPVVGAITAALIVIAVLVGIHQYRAYKSRNAELIFEYIDRPPAYNATNLWNGVKSTVQSMLQRPHSEEKQPLNPQQFQPPDPFLQPAPQPAPPYHPPSQEYNPPVQVHYPTPQPTNPPPQQQQQQQPPPPPPQQQQQQQYYLPTQPENSRMLQNYSQPKQQYNNSPKNSNEQPQYQQQSSADREREDSPPRQMPWADNFVSFASFGTFAPTQN